jgi:hypothetical protein
LTNATHLLIPTLLYAAGNPAAEACRNAAATLEKGKAEEAIDLLRTALQEAWQQCPFILRNATLIAQPPAGYGLFSPRPSNRYQSGETIYLYLEPMGYTVKAEKGLYTFGLTADFNLLDANGVVLGGQREFGKWVTTSHRFNTEFMMHFNFDFSGLEPGNYTVEVTVNDEFGRRSATVKQPLVIQ